MKSCSNAISRPSTKSSLREWNKECRLAYLASMSDSKNLSIETKEIGSKKFLHFSYISLVVFFAQYAANAMITMTISA